MGAGPAHIKQRHIDNCTRADPAYGVGVAKAQGMTALAVAKAAEQRSSHRRSGRPSPVAQIPRRRRNEAGLSVPDYRTSSNALAALRSVVANPSVNRS